MADPQAGRDRAQPFPLHEVEDEDPLIDLANLPVAQHDVEVTPNLNPTRIVESRRAGGSLLPANRVPFRGETVWNGLVGHDDPCSALYAGRPVDGSSACPRPTRNETHVASGCEFQPIGKTCATPRSMTELIIASLASFAAGFVNSSAGAADA
jgi:hypothetical protein